MLHLLLTASQALIMTQRRRQLSHSAWQGTASGPEGTRVNKTDIFLLLMRSRCETKNPGGQKSKIKKLARLCSPRRLKTSELLVLVPLDSRLIPVALPVLSPSALD
nr:uncharacterized protein LOC106824647 isoform X2 [Equus asinus]